MKTPLKKKITRYGKSLIAEAYYSTGGNFTADVVVDSKTFNGRSFFRREPTDKDYEEANAWLDRVVLLHYKHTKNLD